MTSETLPAPDSTPDVPPAAPEDAPETEPNDVLETESVSTTAGVWRCLNERCPEAIQGATFLGVTQAHAQGTGEHPVCPGCNNEPAPHYIYERDNAATAASA